MSHHSQPTNSWLLLTPSLSLILPLPDGRARQCQSCLSPPASCWGAWGVACQPPPLSACARRVVLALALLRYRDAGGVTDTETDGLASGTAEGEWPTLSPALPARVLAGRKSSSRALFGWSAATRPPVRAGDGRKRAEAGSGRRGSGRGHRAGLEHHVSPKSQTPRSRRPLNSDPRVLCCPCRAQPLLASRMLLTR